MGLPLEGLLFHDTIKRSRKAWSKHSRNLLER
jgi:hypothetical protein